jgi:hypothetical protein
MHLAISMLEGWAVTDTTGAVCFLSRYPLRAPPATMPAQNFRAAGGSASAKRYEVMSPIGTLTVFVLHLETPRHGVQHLLTDPSNAPRLIDANNLLRETESRVVRRWVDSTAGARLVIGDFQLPVESIIWQQFWAASMIRSMRQATAGVSPRTTVDPGAHRSRAARRPPEGGRRARRRGLGSDHLPYMAEVQRK